MEKITEIVVENEELPPEFADEKFGRVDIKVTIDHKEKINIELQAESGMVITRTEVCFTGRRYLNTD